MVVSASWEPILAHSWVRLGPLDASWLPWAHPATVPGLWIKSHRKPLEGLLKTFLKPPGGPLWGLFWASGGPLLGLFGPLGGLLGRPGGLLERKARVVGSYSPFWAPFGAVLKPLGLSWAPLGRFGGLLGPSWGPLGGLLGRLGAILGSSLAVWGIVTTKQVRTPNMYVLRRE